MSFVQSIMDDLTGADTPYEGDSIGQTVSDLVTGPVGQFATAAAGLYGGVTGLGNLAGGTAGLADAGSVASTAAGGAPSIGGRAGGVIPGIEMGATPSILGANTMAAAPIASSTWSSLPSWAQSALGSAAGPVAGSLISGYMAKSAAEKQAEAATRAADLNASATDKAIALQQQQLAQQQGIYDTARADVAPWREAGRNALARMSPGLQVGGEFDTAQPFSFNASQMYDDPGYQFRLSEGIKALDRTAAARGGLLSGAQLKGISRYGQDYAANEYGNAFNRALTGYNSGQQNTANSFNRLASMAGLGQTANQQLQSAGQNFGAAGQNYASNVGNLGISSAGAYGDAGLVGAAANSAGYAGIGSSVNRLLTSPQVTNAMSNLFNQSSYGASGGAYPGDVPITQQPNLGYDW